MAKLTSKKRKKIKSSDFGLPDERKYPMPDKSHAINAKARATQMSKKGVLSPEDEKKIKEKADAIIKERKSKKNKKKYQ